MILTKEEILEKVLPVFRKYNVREAYLFGSYARGEATENSDVDILIEDELPFGDRYNELTRFKEELIESLDREVDVMLLSTLLFEKRRKNWFADLVLNDMRELYVNTKTSFCIEKDVAYN